MGKKRKSREVWAKLFGFSVGDNVLIKTGYWRKIRYGIVVLRSHDKELKKPYLVHYGMIRARSLEYEYKKAGVFKEKELMMDEVQRVKTFEEWQDEEREKISKSR